VELRGLEPWPSGCKLAGTALLAVERCSLVRVWMAALDSRSAQGLLYFAAVRDDRHHLIRRDLRPRWLPARSIIDLRK
jgi:hypothetical protein